MNDRLYKEIINSGNIIYAYHKIICDDNEMPIDFEFIEVSDNFEKITGIKALNIVGNRAKEIIPNNLNTGFDWIKVYGEVALTGVKASFTQYIDYSNQVYRINVYSPEKYYFVCTYIPLKAPELELYKDNQRYKNIMENATEVVWSITLDGKIIFVSPSIEKVAGYKVNDVQGKYIKDIVPSEVSIYLESKIKNNLDFYLDEDKRVKYTFEYELTRTDGEKILMQHDYRILKGADNKPFEIWGVSRDITTQKKNEKKLAQSEEKLRLILDSTDEGIFGIDLEGNCTFVNASCLRLLKYSHEFQMLGKNMHNLIHHHHLSGDVFQNHDCKVFKSLLSGTGNYSNDEVFWKSDGTYFYTEYFSFPQFFEGKIVGLVVTFRDITDRKLVENQLRESERSKSVLLNNLPGMAYRCKWDKEWTMLFASKGCHELTGYQPEDLINNHLISFNSLIDQDYRQAVAVKWDLVLRRNKPFRNEYVITTASGEKKWVLEQGQGVLDDKGQVEAIEGLIIDISLQKQKQEEIAYLTYHDSLTKVNNRIFFDSEVKRLDKIQCNPLSIIICDINGLKLVNDGFGHSKGDELIIQAANILKHACTENDILARIGGDEFAILLPNTSLIEVEERFDLINQFCKDYNNTVTNEAFQINISLGFATRTNEFDDFSLTIKSAEDYMLKRKLFERKSSHSTILSSITATMFEKCEETEQHAERLNSLTAMLGKALNLSEFELDELALLATLHDIGKVGIDDKILKKPGKLTDDEWKIMQKHPSIGYRIAKATPELSSIAEYILCHHERWDGNGYPQKLSGDNIPLLSRIVSVADAFDAMTVDRVYRKAMTEEAAINEIIDNAGTQFDPEIAFTFVNLIQKLD